MRCAHCGTPIGEHFLMVAFNCDHFVLIGAECCNPRIGMRRPQTRVECAEIAAEVQAIFDG